GLAQPRGVRVARAVHRRRQRRAQLGRREPAGDDHGPRHPRRRPARRSPRRHWHAGGLRPDPRSRDDPHDAGDLGLRGRERPQRPGGMLTRVGLVAVGAAAIGFVLVRDPYSPLGPSLAAMGVAFGALALLVALELRRSRLDTRVVAVAGAGLLVLAVVVPPLQSRDMWSYAM